MKQKYTLTLDNEFIEFCKLNNIIDVEKKAKEAFDRGFTIIKFGEIPNKNKEIIEKIVEKIVEIPVEVIVEKKGETITKEISVEKIVEVINTDEIDRLKMENKKLQDELDKITSVLTKASKPKFMKNSDLSSLYDE